MSKFTLVISSDAKSDIITAIKYYNKQQKGLGDKFLMNYLSILI